ncbi:hypothetical protein ACWGQ5_33780 [Streptomyces sp. NPDC055722]
MADTDRTERLYILSSIYSDYRLTGETGPSLLISDPALAMRWYLGHEREEGLAVAGQVSDDGGVTWRPLPVSELFADAERAVPTAQHAPLLRDALAGEAADWLDARIRFVPSDDPTPWRPAAPDLDAWRRGGQIWALAMSAVPDEALLAHLRAQYAVPGNASADTAAEEPAEGRQAGQASEAPEARRPDLQEGCEAAREAARQMLGALALAEKPGTASVPELFAAFRLVEELSFASAIGQLRDRVEQTQDQLLDELSFRVPETAELAAAYPAPEHPVRRAARTVVQRLAHDADRPGAGQELLARARTVLADAVAAPDAAVAGDEETAEPEPPSLPGFPRQVTDGQAAAAWRAMFPLARREAEMVTADLVRAESWLLQAAADAASWVAGRPRDAERAKAFDQLTPAQQRWEARHVRNAEADARDNVRYFQQWLEELNARHAVLMHGSILADAEAAATTAKQQAVIAFSEATEAAAPRTVGERLAMEEAFVARVDAAEEGIDQVLGIQRQLTRDARQRLYPQTAGSWSVRDLRTLLVDRGPIGQQGYTEAYEAVGAAARALSSLEERLGSGYVDFGSPAVTKEQVEQARQKHERAEQYFADVSISRPVTLRALKAVDSVAGLRPTRGGGVLGYAAQIAADSRNRTAQPVKTPERGADHATAQQLQQAHHLQLHQPGSGIRPA